MHPLYLCKMVREEMKCQRALKDEEEFSRHLGGREKTAAQADRRKVPGEICCKNYSQERAGGDSRDSFGR